MTTLRQAAQKALDAINVIIRKEQPATVEILDLHIAAGQLTDALESPEQDGETTVLQAKCDAFLANTQMALEDLAAMTAERDEYQRAADSMAMSHKVERDALMVAGNLALEALEQCAASTKPANRPMLAVTALKEAGVK